MGPEAVGGLPTEYTEDTESGGGWQGKYFSVYPICFTGREGPIG